MTLQRDTNGLECWFVDECWSQRRPRSYIDSDVLSKQVGTEIEVSQAQLDELSEAKSSLQKTIDTMYEEAEGHLTAGLRSTSSESTKLVRLLI